MSKRGGERRKSGRVKGEGTLAHIDLDEMRYQTRQVSYHYHSYHILNHNNHDRFQYQDPSAIYGRSQECTPSSPIEINNRDFLSRLLIEIAHRDLSTCVGGCDDPQRENNIVLTMVIIVTGIVIENSNRK